MGFALKGFIAGAATAISERIDVEEKAAQETAKFSVNNLYKSLEENKKKTREQIAEYTGNLSTLKTHFPGLTEEQLYYGAINPAFMKGVDAKIKEGRLNNKDIDLKQLIDLADTVPTEKKAQERIDALADLTNVKPLQPIPPGMGTYRERAQQKAFDRYAKSLNLDPATLMAAGQGITTPTVPSTVKFNMEALNKPKTLQEQKELTAAAVIEAKRNNDDVALAKATEDATRIKLAEDLVMKGNKTEDQIQTDLRNQIMASKDPKEKTLLTNELRQRQILSKLPGEGQEKVSQSNLITVATKAVTAAVADALPPGSFVITTDAQGNQTLAPKDIVSAKQFNEATTAGRRAVIKEMTTEDGKPRSEMHRNALISIGVGFDENGRAVAPKVGVQPTPVDTPPPAPAKPAASAAPAAPAAQTALPLPFTAEGAPDKAKLVKGQAYVDNGVVKTWTGIGWK